ncbi:MAG: hypothetical protein WC464_03685 [Bdellovibrionales bacterium]
MCIFKKLRSDPGLNYSLADTFLFAQIPNLYAAIPACLTTGYIFLRTVATGKTAEALERFERPIEKFFFLIHPYIPIIHRIPADQYRKDKKGAATLMIGTAQYAIAAASFIAAVMDPANPIGWLAATAAAFFSAFNLIFGLQLNNPETVKATVRWKDVLKSPPFLDAAGVCCSGLMAGLATSFGWGASVPIGIALASAALIAMGKIGKGRLNAGIPMFAMFTIAALNVVVGIANGRWLAAISNVFAANGEGIVTLFYNRNYRSARAKAFPEATPSRETPRAKFLHHIYFKETT